MTTTWLVVGLGNPGPDYATHRHNIGYLVVDELARRAGASFSKMRLMPLETVQTRISASGIGGIGADADKVILLKSRTFMNESGRAVGKAAKYFNLTPEQVVVIHDELDINFATLRLKLGGGDNGHNGLKSIRSALGSGDFYRVRFGIGRPPGRQEPYNFVLSGFNATERKTLDTDVARAADAVEALLTQGLERAQNQFNS
ncbi:MAG: aminoacyl-tRNA hydrolase [Propionibacteriaceae bacterium]|jgi:PTH1 family peptidyl-tRNA hydrolase|nr:aminoacyl-tRNA hydrolase [Propionibacteriaceae bacterium]